MSTDPDNDDVDDDLANKSDAELQTELLRRMKRAGDSARVRHDQVFQLDMDNLSAAPDDPLLQIGYALVPQLPGHWDDVLLDLTSAADDVRTMAMVRMQEEGDEPPDNRIHFFSDLTEPALALRRSTYEPNGRGAWYTAMIRLARDGTITAKFEFDLPPFGLWGPNEVALVSRDQELYPRDPARLPRWHPAR
ncbi:hypothetical protein CLV30_109131 [Haloactinopolyspora alba]|uniref:Uncharacterized protein n=1 Tax=Haloactinopolyspora alba TaxID=648780 RepID=A0A2P8E020_9ACTN|nr:hypothetical protein [Haloactinopolyspora alba]PSL02823.1 hypothetical protein CLV30_109131 [Haloactinopolyspora alba]